MKKKIVIFVSVLLFLVTVFFACTSCTSKPKGINSGGDDPPTETEDFTKEDNPLNNEKYKVVFYDYDGKTILLESEVEKGDSAIPPEPRKDGCEFLGWEGDYSNIIRDTTLRAVYSDEKNVFLLSTVSTVQNQVKVNLQLCGEVKTCGFDLTISYDDTILELLSVDDWLDLVLIYNQQGKRIYVNYSSANDQVKKKSIIDLTFQLKNVAVDYTKIYVEMTSIKEINGQLIDDCDYTIIDNIIKINNQGEDK